MITDAITTVRRRDHLDTLCPNCCESQLRTYSEGLVYCTVCSFSCDRFLTKAELLDILMPDDMEDDTDFVELEEEDETA